MKGTEDISGRGNTGHKGRGTKRTSRREMGMAKDYGVCEAMAAESGKVN